MWINDILSKDTFKTKTARRILVVACLIGFSFQSFSQQNILYSQYIFNTLSINPAYAGYKEAWYLQTAHRMQWAGMSGAPTTTQVSIDGLTNNFTKNVGLGLQLTADKEGAQSATSLYANYAYRLQLDRADMSRLCFGLAAGVTQYATNMSILEPTDPTEPIMAEGINNTYIPDLRFGIYYYNPNFFIGASVMDLLSAETAASIFKLDVDSTSNLMRKQHFYLIAGWLRELNSFIKFRPSITVREDFKGPTNLDLSATFVFGDRFWIGGNYRTGIQLWDKEYLNGASLSNLDAVYLTAQFQITERIRIGYSYDYTLNQLGSDNNVSHEFSFGWIIPEKAKRILSPRFF
ncbi:MAG: type IX secretion system membrane protein PorP/SprF [Bacteroidales bacterium]|nr:type IX secretion system membrane protein PorP/SprF [Bacteroidales bacterium]